MNSLEEVLKLTLWSLPIRLGWERCYVLVSSTPPLFILVIVKSLKICFSEQVVFPSSKFSPPLKCYKSSSGCPQGKDQRKEKYINEHNNSKPLKMLFPSVLGLSGISLRNGYFGSCTGNQSPGISSLQFLYKFPLREFQKYLTQW